MKRCCVFLLLLSSLQAFGQSVNQPNAAQIKLKLKKLNFLGAALYVAAHPDDENTRVITYLSNDRLATTAYLSLTRGDGGQNLIGSEMRDLLGVIRTQELLAARRIDGGQQFFTRANDFGFSKSADETLQIWGKDEILSDVVKVFREFQPDVIITRFPPDERAGHGHHTTSAVLALEAFDLAASASYHPEQISKSGTWQPKRLYNNTGRWWNTSINESTPGVLTLDVGGYNALLGKSYAEISALSSSQHKSQGWGRAGDRGKLLEFFEYGKGDKAEKDFFEGVNTSWSRLKGGEKVQSLVDKAIASFDEEKPSATVTQLLAIRKAINALDNSAWKSRKLMEVEQLMIDCLGLYADASSPNFQGSPGENVRITLELINRSDVPVVLKSISSKQLSWDTTAMLTLTRDAKHQLKSVKALEKATNYSEPYWLQQDHSIGRFDVANPDLIGTPENTDAISFSISLDIAGETLVLSRPLIHRWVDPVKGELLRRFEVVPAILVNLTEKVLLVDDGSQPTVKLQISSTVDHQVAGVVRLDLPQGWKSTPESQAFEVQKRDQTIERIFTLTPPQGESVGLVKAIASVGDVEYTQSLRLIQYDHIPTQTILPDATMKVVKSSIKKSGEKVAYIKGAGDEIPSALRNIGYEVVELTNDEVTTENLKKFDAVVMGIRALNTNEKVKYFMADLLSYANEGGTLVIQYNTSHDLEVETFSPYPMKLSRDRVTQEDCEVTFLKQDHRVLNFPNKITSVDFQNWVQERGLYFPGQWDPKYDAVLAMNDKGEKSKESALLVAQYGKGYFVYTGISFFRQLPEGVAGAYKLFANIVSLGADATPPPAKSKNKTK